MTNYQHLRQLAENATNGPYGWFDAEFIRRNFSEGTARDAEFIAAANPAVVLDLLTTIDTLVTQVRNQATELEDTRAAYQLAQRQLNAHRAGQGTYEGTTP